MIPKRASRIGGRSTSAMRSCDAPSGTLCLEVETPLNFHDLAVTNDG